MLLRLLQTSHLKVFKCRRGILSSRALTGNQTDLHRDHIARVTTDDVPYLPVSAGLKCVGILVAAQPQ